MPIASRRPVTTAGDPATDGLLWCLLLPSTTSGVALAQRLGEVVEGVAVAAVGVSAMSTAAVATTAGSWSHRSSSGWARPHFAWIWVG